MKKYSKQIERFFCLAVIMWLFGVCSSYGSKEAVSVNDNFVVIDAGHGWPDGGAVGKSGVAECEINLKVAKYIQKELEKSGVSTLMTREGENGIFTDEDESIKNKKREDMRKREKIINESGAALAISVHMNYFGIEKYSGPQVFCPLQGSASYSAAGYIKSSIMKNIGQHCNREIKKVEGGIYLLKKSKIPIVLVECGFLSNEEEERLLTSDSYCKRMGEAIAEGIINYLKSKR